MNVDLPFKEERLLEFKAGDKLELNGILYVARDAAHKKIIEALNKGEALPFNPQGEVIYYMGPSPARPGNVIGSAGPTTSGRMDPYTIALLQKGLKAMIGKGARSPQVKEALQKYRALYLAAVGGAGAYLAERIKAVETVAYPELGAEALLRITVENFPVIVVNDAHGGDLYEEGKKRYRSLN